MLAEAAGRCIVTKHDSGPQGVHGRNSDNTRLRQVLNWEPDTALKEGLAHTYTWIEQQVEQNVAIYLDAARANRQPLKLNTV
jgi:nucleoside-diphosphate-sugar epimerase